VVIDTDVESGFKVTIEQLDAATTDRTKVLLFVSPDNPSGAVYTPAEVKTIGEWAVAKGVWVITDEIYEHLTYGSNEFSSMPVLVPDLADQCVIVNGVAKTYAMTGWRVGWMIGPTDIVKPSTSFQSHATSNVANVSQRAAIAAVSGSLEDVEMMREAFTRRAKLIHGMLNDIPGVVCPEPQGAFYAFPDLRGLLGREYGGVIADTTLDLADIVLDQAKVAWVPGEAFGLPGYGRFSFALGDADIEAGVSRLASLVG
jgi:aspartate/methionine/tyrosine aminotransferase